MKKKIVIIILFGHSALAQNLPSIQLDRPDQTECPFITPTKCIQAENGFNFENASKQEKNYAYPSSLWKYGINEKVEVRFITELVTAKINAASVSGLNTVTFGFKSNLWNEKGIIPKTSFIGHVTTAQIGTKEFQTKCVAPSFRFTMQHTLSKRMTLAYNLGMKWDGNNAEYTYIYTLTTGFGLTDKLGCYAELYGFLPDNSVPDHCCDGGFTYLANNDLMFDLSGGYGITESSPDYYLSLGISFRVRVLK